MTLRRTETALVWVSIGVLAIYVPVETIYSWSGGLGSPYYLIDVIAFALIFAGIVRSLRARPRMAPGVLTAGWGWAGANFWRATFDRIATLQRGGTLDMGSLELRFVCGELVVSLLCLAVGLVLIYGSRVE
jgi:hypothetical protein